MSSFTSSSSSSAAAAATTYGIRSVAQIKQETRPSDRLTRRRLEAQRYFIEKVDPIIGACITHILCYQPEDVPNGMLDYFLALKSGTKPKAAWGAAESKSKVRQDQKVLFARQVGPIISKLVNRIAITRPDDVTGFFFKELESIINFEKGVYGVEYEVTGKLTGSKKADEQSGGSRVADESSSSSKPSAAATTSTVPQPVAPTPNFTPAPSTEDLKATKTIQLAFFGMDGAGKTSIINSVQDLAFDPNQKATVGFRPISMQLDALTNVKLFDLGGGAKIRDIWGKYYHDIHGYIYVFDGKLLASGSKEDVDAACALYATTISNAHLVGKPALIVFNKDDDRSDFGGAIANIVSRLSIKDSNTTTVFSSNILSSSGGGEDSKLDSRFDAGLTWMFDNINSNFSTLSERVKADCKKIAAEEAKKRLEKERKVMRNKIASAFISTIEPSKLPEGVSEDPEQIFDETEGLSFLAAEINEEVPNLSKLAKDSAAGVGYQRLALQMIGAWKTPISKSKVPMTWEDIYSTVCELRTDLGLA